MPSYDETPMLSTVTELTEDTFEFPSGSDSSRLSTLFSEMSEGMMEDATCTAEDISVGANEFLVPPAPHQKRDNNETFCKSPHPRLSEQFSKGHEALDAAKASVYAEQLRVKELTAQLLLTEKDVKDCKNVINVLTTQLKEVDDEVRLLKNEAAEKSKVAEEASLELEEAKKIVEREERRRIRLESNMKEYIKEAEGARKALAELKDDNVIKSKEAEEMQKQIQELKLQLDEQNSQSLKDTVMQLEFVVRENEFKLEEKAQEVEASKKNVQLLKDACAVLEDQLKRMEVVLEEKEECVRQAVSEKTALIEGIKAKDEQIRAVKIENNAAKSQQIFLEKQLECLQAKWSQESSDKGEMIANLRRDIDEMKHMYEEKLLNQNKLAEEVAALKEEKQILECVNQELKTKEVRYGLEISRYLENIVNSKEQNINLKTDLHEANQKVEFYRRRATELMEEKNIADIDKMQKEVELQSTINQQAKLVQFFQSQAQQLSATKKKKFRLFGKEKPIELPQPPADLTPQTKKKYFPDVSYIPRTPTSASKTPTRVLNEPKVMSKLQFDDDDEFSSTEEDKCQHPDDASSCATSTSDSFTNRS